MQTVSTILQAPLRERLPGLEPASRFSALQPPVLRREIGFERFLARADARNTIDRKPDIERLATEAAPTSDLTRRDDRVSDNTSDLDARSDQTADPATDETPAPTADSTAGDDQKTEAQSTPGEAQVPAEPAQDLPSDREADRQAPLAESAAPLIIVEPSGPEAAPAGASAPAAGSVAAQTATVSATLEIVSAPIGQTPVEPVANQSNPQQTPAAPAPVQPLSSESTSAQAAAPIVTTPTHESSQRPAQSGATNTASSTPLGQSTGHSAVVQPDTNPQSNTHDQNQQQDASRHNDGRFIPTRRDPSSQSLSPAGARVLEVESNVQLTNLTGQAAEAPTSTQVRDAAQAVNSAKPTVAAPGAPDLASARETALTNAQTNAIESDRFSGRIVRGMSTMINQRGGVMTMRLDPPELGQLRIQMTIVQGVVTAEFHAANEQARAMLDRNLATLRTSLENSGLTVDRLHVSAGHNAQNADGRETGNESNNSERDRHEHNAAGRESRGRREQDGEQRQSWRQNLSEQMEFEMPNSTQGADIT